MRTVFLLLSVFCASEILRAGAPLHERVDALIREKAEGRVFSEGAEDAVFLRRAYLDFEGGLPAPEVVRAFLADAALDKRARVIDQLLDSPRYAERMMDAFDVMLMERRGQDTHWEKFLQASFAANKPWDIFVREVLDPDFRDEVGRGAGYFITNRLTKVGQQPTDYPGLTRDVGRLFMGVDLQCAQCHKHLTVKDYKQLDFNGLYAAYLNLKLQRANVDHKTAWVSENLMEKKHAFASVFTEKAKQTGPRVPFGEEVEVPVFEKDEGWATAPDRKKKVVGVPRFRPLRVIADGLAHADNPYFARNAVNRAWFLFMGRGLVEPLDLQHSKNPPSHPEVLDLLAEAFVAQEFDLKWLLRELALTQTYQRSSLLPQGEDAETGGALYLFAKERPLTAAQLQRAFLQATGELARAQQAKPLEDDGQTDSEEATVRDVYTLEEWDNAFYAAFANAPKEPELEVSPTLRAALFFRNSELVDWALHPRDGNLVSELLKVEEPEDLAERLFLRAYARLPYTEEVSLVKNHLSANSKNRASAIGQLAWSLLTSMEFFANH